MFASFAKAFGQLRDPRILRVIMMSVMLSVAVYASLIGALLWLLQGDWVASLPMGGTVAAWGAGLLAVIIATLLFPAVVTGFAGLWLDVVAKAVEAAHYPALAPARAIPILEALGMSLRLMVSVLAINILLLPLYLVLIFVPPLNLVIYYGINGRLLGREYFETVALRRLTPAAMDTLRRENGGTLWMAGAITAFLLTVPLLNMLAPVIGTAAMVHVFQKLTSRS